LRITGGQYKGRSIHCPPGTIRPAMDRMRESLFSALGPIDGLSFLDLFSGSGTIALEAASRGAVRVHSVEKDPRKREVIRRNLEVAGGVCTVSFSPVERFILKRQERFDVVFLDPPFPYRHKNDLLQKLIDSALLGDGSLVLMHFPSENDIFDRFDRNDGSLALEMYKRKEYGRSIVQFYRAFSPSLSPASDQEDS
jgi:16S rRNA (guanine966-N2)-methyltransferase